MPDRDAHHIGRRNFRQARLGSRSKQCLDLLRAPLQNCTLIDRALVGDFAPVDGRRFIEQGDPLQATGIARGLAIESL